MKKYKIIIYIVLIIITILLGFFLYNVLGQENSEEEAKEKTLSEIKYLENRFVEIFNKLNNITFENYQISSSKIEGNTVESGEGNTTSQENNNSNNSTENSNSTSKNSNKSENNSKFNMSGTGVLTNEEEIDWKEIKNEVELMYNKLYSSTLDLYQTSVKQEDIINFNKEYDNLTVAVKQEEKSASLKSLAKLYNYLSQFIDASSKDEKEKTVIRTKNKIFQAYSILDDEDWNLIGKNINEAIQEFTKLVTNINNTEKGSQYNINRVYIMLNELSNSIQIKDKDVFLIKYKNVLEELQNL